MKADDLIRCAACDLEIPYADACKVKLGRARTVRVCQGCSRHLVRALRATLGAHGRRVDNDPTRRRKRTSS